LQLLAPWNYIARNSFIGLHYIPLLEDIHAYLCLKRTLSTHYEPQDIKEDNKEAKELDFAETTDPHDQLQVDELFLIDPKYTTRVKATDNTRGLMPFRGNNDTRDPPIRPVEKPNDVSKRTGLSVPL
jgi:hypothetical protein